MESPEPMVSVIIPTYNWSSALRFAIGSVLWQTLQNFELLVVGDGCTDDSAEVVASFGDQRIRWHNLPQNTGNQPAANNAGIAMARGRYIAYLGHDDLWLPRHLERLTAALEHTGADLAYGWVEMIGPDPVHVRVICGITKSGEYETGTCLVPSCIMHRRAMVADTGPWKDHRTVLSPPDQEFIERAFRTGKKFVPVKKLTALKFTATWRPNCYVEKPVHQQADYSRRIRENPEFAADELRDVVEFLYRKHPLEIARNNLAKNTRPGQVVESGRRIRGLEPMPLSGAPAPSEYPPLRDRIDLGNEDCDPYLQDGWSGQEAGFRWTDGPEARFIFALDNITSLQMCIRCAPLLEPGKLDSQTVSISCNGAEIAQWKITGTEMKIHSMELDQRFLRNENTLVFKLPDATAPMQLVKGNMDSRQLGLRVEWIEVKRV